MAIVALLMAFFHSVTASAADTWSVNPSAYRYDMSLYLDVAFATGEKLDYEQYDVAAFVGDECRGVAEVLALPNGNNCLYLRARSNSENGEQMSFRYRDKSTGEVKDIENVNFSFKSNERLGYPSSPYEVKIVIYHDVAISAGDGGTVNESGGRLAEGTTLTLTATPAEGHHFVKWSDDVTDNPRSVTVGKEDITLAAEFALSSYHLTYTLDGTTYKESDVLYGTALTAEPNPEKEGYTFSGWEGLPETMPAHDVEVTGKFTINTYKAVFKIGEEIIDTKTVVFGEAVTAPEAPAKEGHTFAGWQDVPQTMPAHDIEVLGSYTVNKYMLTYKVDGEEYKTVEVDYGKTITPETPEKEGYTFSGWEGLPETMPAHDVEVTGSFAINSYKAVFKIGEEVIDTKTIVYGEAVTAPEAPEKEGHTFAGWQDVPETMPAHDIEILGSYTANKYTITYKVDGEEYKTVEVEYGTTLTAEADPEKEGYTFSGWEGLPETMPAHDVEVTGSFTINSYKAVFKIGEEVIDTKTIVYGEAVTVPEAPAKEGRTFAGWQDVPETMPAHDIEILGSYTANKYTITYKVDGEEYKTVEVEYGTTLTAEADPEKEGYTFSGWEGLPETMPAHDVEVTGSFTINSYRLTVYVDNELYMDVTLEYGAPVEVPEPEIPSDREFNGWDRDIPETMPAHDVEIHGTTTPVSGLEAIFADSDTRVTICSINGVVLFRNTTVKEAAPRLNPGMYIVNGRKMVVK